jgi:HAE1 family hydrophobic/amphiphilic exporter-1
VVGGLVVSQLLTLYITPVFYIYLERFQGLTRRFRRPARKMAAAATEPEIAFKP